MAEVGHAPVLLAEVVEALQPAPGRLIVDATFGAGGYSRAFRRAGARVIAFDRDPTVRRFAEGPEFGRDFELIEDRFSSLARHVGEAGADGVAFDLGLSSMQLDAPERGFSLMRDGPLDMRMGEGGPSASELVNGAGAAELARIFRSFGEERQAARIAAAVVRRRTERPF